MHKILLLKIEVLGFIRLILASHIVPRIRYLGFTPEGRGCLEYDGGFFRLQVHLKFNTNIHRQQSGGTGGRPNVTTASFFPFLSSDTP
jgi:hypothetical protein